jgi:hypothetical protein
MLINVKKKKKKMFFIGRTDGQTHVQLKTIVRNLTKLKFKNKNSPIFLFYYTIKLILKFAF